MKVKLIQQYKLGNTDKPVGRILEVTSEFGNDLIQDGIAEPLEVTIEKKRNKKTTIKTEK